MKIRMTNTAPGSIDGIHVQQYEAGIEYDLSGSQGAEDLALAFVGAGFATNADEVPLNPPLAQRAKPGPKPKAK
jgi:hypothetical protein